MRTQSEPVKKTKITLNVSTPTEYEVNGEKKTFWTNLGKAFDDGEKIIVRLNALPMSGTLLLQLPKEKE